jgi:hypothetical protein
LNFSGIIDVKCFQNITWKYEATSKEKLPMGAFWNPYGGIVVSEKQLEKAKVSLLKPTWPEQLQSSISPFDGWWKRLRKLWCSFLG